MRVMSSGSERDGDRARDEDGDEEDVVEVGAVRAVGAVREAAE